MKKILLFAALIALSQIAFAQPATKMDPQARRIFMLEYALAPHNSSAVTTTWAEAVKNRNGAVQYMLMCPQLQEKSLTQMEELNWVTGTSSPRVVNYKIVPINANRFEIIYRLSIDNKQNIDSIIIKKLDPHTNSSQQWCVDQVTSSHNY